MKKMVLGLSLFLVALAFLVSPARASSLQPALSAADQAFLASLAESAGTPAPVPAAKRPAVGGKSLCTATASCGGGVTVSCSGNNSVTSCSAADRNCAASERGHVTCDGVTTSCSTCPVDCDMLENQCAESCSPCPIKTFQCSPYRCRCSFSPNCV